MNRCSQCGQPIEKVESRCPHCGSLNSKIDDILAKEAAEAEKKTLKGRLKIIIQAEDKKQALFLQLSNFRQSLNKEILFTLFVIFIFIFAMSYAVI